MNPPCVLVLSGLDPSGGAGVQADIETFAALGVHACPIITALTAQNSHNVVEVYPVAPAILRRQLTVLLQDMPIIGCKIGLLGGVEQARLIAELLAAHPQWSVVLDPVLAAGGGAGLANQQTQQILRDTLLPHVTLLTPNVPEAQCLSGESDLNAAGQVLLGQGCEAVLITGTHQPEAAVHNVLYRTGHSPLRETWPRLPHTYHGSGCTLAAASAAGLAKGLTLPDAVHQAQTFTWHALKRSFLPADGQWFAQRSNTPLTAPFASEQS